LAALLASQRRPGRVPLNYRQRAPARTQRTVSPGLPEVARNVSAATR